MTTTTFAPTMPRDTLVVDTYDWDTVFAIPYPRANQAVADSWKTQPASVTNFDSASEGFEIKGVFAPWLLAPGGSGDLANLSCPIQSGSYTTPGTNYDLTGCTILVQARMQWVPNPTQLAFSISDAAEVTTITTALSNAAMPAALTAEFVSRQLALGPSVTVTVCTKGSQWQVSDNAGHSYYVFFQKDKYDNQFLHVYQAGAQWNNQLVVMGNAASSDLPAVTILNIDGNPVSSDDTVASGVFPLLLSNWFNANIANLTHVFASLNIATQLDPNSQWNWITPTSTGYAVIDDNTMENTVFAVLTMDEDDVQPAFQQVSPNAIPPGADAGFLISGPQFVQHMMLAGASVVFNGAPATAFTISDDGLTVSNSSDLVWGNFVIDHHALFTVKGDYSQQLNQQQLPKAVSQAFSDNNYPVSSKATVSTSGDGASWLLTDGGSQYALQQGSGSLSVYKSVELKIAAKCFQLSLQDTQIQVQFINLEYPYNSDLKVHVNYTEQLTLTLAQKGSKNVLWFDNSVKSMVINVTQTKAAIDRQIVMGVATAVLSLLAVAGPLLEGLASGGDITEGIGEGAFKLDSKEFESLESANEDEVEESESEAGTTAADDLKGNKWSSIKNAFRQPRWKLFAAFAGIAGGVTGLDQLGLALESAAAKDDWEKVPDFGQFANLCIQPYTWTGVSNFSLVSAQLAQSLQLGLQLQSN